MPLLRYLRLRPLKVGRTVSGRSGALIAMREQSNDAVVENADDDNGDDIVDVEEATGGIGERYVAVFPTS